MTMLMKWIIINTARAVTVAITRRGCPDNENKVSSARNFIPVSLRGSRAAAVQFGLFWPDGACGQKICKKVGGAVGGAADSAA